MLDAPVTHKLAMKKVHFESGSESKNYSSERDLNNLPVLSNTSSKEVSMLQINIVRVRAVTIKALLTVQGIRTKAVVDTGAEVTVMSEYLYNLIPDNQKPCLEKPKRGLVVAEAG